MICWLRLRLVSDGSPNLVCFLLTVLIGNAISWDGDFNVHTEGEVFASVIDFVLNCACFIYIGMWLPFENFHIPELCHTLSQEPFTLPHASCMFSSCLQ